MNFQRMNQLKVCKEFFSEFDARRFDGSAAELGLKIVTRLCNDIEYRRYNGVNLCRLNFPKGFPR